MGFQHFQSSALYRHFRPCPGSRRRGRSSTQGSPSLDIDLVRRNSKKRATNLVNRRSKSSRTDHCVFVLILEVDHQHWKNTEAFWPILRANLRWSQWLPSDHPGELVVLFENLKCGGQNMPMIQKNACSLIGKSFVIWFVLHNERKLKVVVRQPSGSGRSAVKSVISEAVNHVVLRTRKSLGNCMELQYGKSLQLLSVTRWLQSLNDGIGFTRWRPVPIPRNFSMQKMTESWNVAPVASTERDVRAVPAVQRLPAMRHWTLQLFGGFFRCMNLRIGAQCEIKNGRCEMSLPVLVWKGSMPRTKSPKG